MIRLQRIEWPVRAHPHADGTILCDQDGKVAGFQLNAVRRECGFKNALGILQKIGHEYLSSGPSKSRVEIPAGNVVASSDLAGVYCETSETKT